MCRPLVGRHVRWRTAAAKYCIRCKAKPLATQDEVIAMMLDWNDYQRQLGTTTAEIGRISPDTIRGYRGLADAGKSGPLDGKTRELIALGVAITRQCDGCITIHTDAAIKQGATREEIVAALSVAISVNAGATLVYSARVMDAYAAKTAGT